jgi:hypothetical protein
LHGAHGDVTTADTIVLIVMALAAAVAAGAFSTIATYLFDRGLADRHHFSPDIRLLYRTYISQTRQESGRIGRALWIHGLGAGIFILTGTIYAIVRVVLPLLF